MSPLLARLRHCETTRGLRLSAAKRTCRDGSPRTGFDRIGFLFGGTIALRPQAQEFWRKLEELGYVRGKNLIAEVREAHGEVDRLPKLAAEIVDTHPDVIVAVTPSATAAAKTATQTIPIVMAIVPDPVGAGFVKSLARPGTNITGSSNLQVDLAPKRVQLIKEILSEVPILGMLWNEQNPGNVSQVPLVEQAARTLGVAVRPFPVRSPEDLKPTFDKAFQQHVASLYVAGDAMIFDHRADVVALSIASRIPTFHTWPEEAFDGAVGAYGAELTDQYRQAAVYVGKILAGAAPADLPVDQATRFEFVINMKTARAIGLKVPESVLLRADKVIE
jgi:putative ABC transport system substrate-binding protein